MPFGMCRWTSMVSRWRWCHAISGSMRNVAGIGWFNDDWASGSAGGPPRRAEVVLLSEVLATRLRLRAGGTVSRSRRRQDRVAVPVEGVFYDYATDGGKMVMDRTRYSENGTTIGCTVFRALPGCPGAERIRFGNSIVEAVHRSGGVRRSPPLVIRNHELRREILDIFDRSFVLTYVLEAIAVFVAVLGIVNTLVTAVLERRREFATLRAIGASTRQVERLVLWEAVYLGLIGAVLGVVGGLATRPGCLST